MKKLMDQEASGEELPQKLMWTLLEAILNISLISACLIISGEKHNFWS